MLVGGSSKRGSFSECANILAGSVPEEGWQCDWNQKHRRCWGRYLRTSEYCCWPGLGLTWTCRRVLILCDAHTRSKPGSLDTFGMFDFRHHIEGVI